MPNVDLRQEEISLSKKSTFIKTIFISFFFHAIVLGGVIFSFTVSEGAKKPFFVFLGSILPKQDFLFSNEDSSRTVAGIPPFSQSLIPSRHSIYPSPVSKPSVLRDFSSRQKKLFKVQAFRAEDQPENQKNSPIPDKSSGIDSPIPPYVPLRLHTK